MGLKSWIRKLVAEEVVALPEVVEPAPEPAPKAKKPRKPRKPREAKPKEQPKVCVVDPNLAAKAHATATGEPWVAVISLDLDEGNLGTGSFTLDWNEIFVARLVKAGYKGDSDVKIVDQWFTDLAKNIVLEFYEQNIADPTNRTAELGAHLRNSLNDR